MTAIILSGGQSTRMGFDKAFIKLDGMSLIERQLKILKRIFSRQAILNDGGISPEAGKKIIIVTNSPKKYKFRNIKVVSDIIAHRGPLGGIYSGLMASNSFYNFVIACDMPFINEALIRYMIGQKDNYDIIIPRLNKKFHPLFGIYSRECIPVIKESLKHKRLKVSSIFPKVKTRFILKQEIERFDGKLLSLVNINTKEDLIKYKKY